ncbi:MAG: hypothetical protein ACQEV0_13875 [Bacillota bacterium]
MINEGLLVKPLGNAWQEPQTSGETYRSLANGEVRKTIRLLGYDSGGRAVNQVDIWLTAEELPVFIHALVTHPFLLPTDYLQTSEQWGSGFRVRIRSHESSKIFVARLSSAINCLEQPA